MQNKYSLKIRIKFVVSLSYLIRLHVMIHTETVVYSIKSNTQYDHAKKWFLSYIVTISLPPETAFNTSLTNWNIMFFNN